MPKGSAKKRPPRPNAKGRTENKTARFTMMPYRLLESAAYASLDLTARCVLQELVMLYNGDNNGSIYLSAADATARLGLADKRAPLRAFDDLRDRGFIVLAKEAHFAVKASDTSRARCWRLTWHAWPECPVRSKRGPTNDWAEYQPPGKTDANKRAERRLRALARFRKSAQAGYFAGVNSTLMEVLMPENENGAGVDFTPLKSENGQNLPFLVGVDSTPYLDDTRGSLLLGWWEGEQAGQILGQILLLHVMTQNWPPLARAA